MQLITFIKLLWNNIPALWAASQQGWRMVLVLATNDPSAEKSTKKSVDNLIRDIGKITPDFKIKRTRRP